jgi:glutaminase
MFDGSMVRSRRRRTPAEIDSLRRRGATIVVLETQGALKFGDAEVISREIDGYAADPTHVVIDVSRVTSIDEGALTLLHSAIQGLAERTIRVAAAGPLAEKLQTGDAVESFRNGDAALEWCEDELLGRLGFSPSDQPVELVEQELLRDLSPDALAIVARSTETRSFSAGEIVFSEGAEADAIYFVVSGGVRVILELDDRRHELTTIGPGASFGEMAAIDGGNRSTTVEAETDTACQVLPLAALVRLERELPGFTEALYRNLVLSLARRLRDANEEIRAVRS